MHIVQGKQKLLLGQSRWPMCTNNCPASNNYEIILEQ